MSPLSAGDVRRKPILESSDGTSQRNRALCGRRIVTKLSWDGHRSVTMSLRGDGAAWAAQSSKFAGACSERAIHTASSVELCRCVFRLRKRRDSYATELDERCFARGGHHPVLHRTCLRPTSIPGTGSMMLQLLLGGIAGAMVVGKLYLAPVPGVRNLAVLGQVERGREPSVAARDVPGE